MKRFLPALLVTVISLFVVAAHAQGYVEARIPFPVPPLPHIHFHAQLPVVVAPYQQGYAPSQPYYDDYGNSQVVITRPEVIYEGRRYDHRYDERYSANRYRGYREHGYNRDGYREHGHGDRGRRHW
jgi:hypothetical protein